MKKISLIKDCEGSLSFRSSDGTERDRHGFYHIVIPGKYVLSNDVPSSVIIDKRFVVENVDDKVKEDKKQKKE